VFGCNEIATSVALECWIEYGGWISVFLLSVNFSGLSSDFGAFDWVQCPHRQETSPLIMFWPAHGRQSKKVAQGSGRSGIAPGCCR
jgi:hypothetical protein